MCLSHLDYCLGLNCFSCNKVCGCCFSPAALFAPGKGSINLFCLVLFLGVGQVSLCTTDAELISTEENQECATVHKCHQKHFVLVLEQRKKKVFGCCNATDSRSHGGILNHAEAIVSLPFFFSLSTS